MMHRILVARAEIHLMQNEHQEAKKIYNYNLASWHLFKKDLALCVRILLGSAECYNKAGYNLSSSIDLIEFYRQSKSIDAKTFGIIDEIKENYADALTCCKRAEALLGKLLGNHEDHIDELETLLWMKDSIIGNINFNMDKINRNYEDYLNEMSSLKERLIAVGLYGTKTNTGPNGISIGVQNLQEKYRENISLKEKIINLRNEKKFFVNNRGSYLVPDHNEIKKSDYSVPKYFSRVGYLFCVTVFINDEKLEGYIHPVWGYYVYQPGSNTMPVLESCYISKSSYFYHLQGKVSPEVFQLNFEGFYPVQELTCSFDLSLNKNSSCMFTDNPYHFFNNALPRAKRRNSFSTLGAQKIPPMRLNFDHMKSEELIPDSSVPPQSSL
jgi:hypothetical protein